MKVFHFNFWKHYSLWSQKRRNVTQLLSNKSQLLPDSAEKDSYSEVKTRAEREWSDWTDWLRAIKSLYSFAAIWKWFYFKKCVVNWFSFMSPEVFSIQHFQRQTSNPVKALVWLPFIIPYFFTYLKILQPKVFWIYFLAERQHVWLSATFNI